MIDRPTSAIVTARAAVGWIAGSSPAMTVFSGFAARPEAASFKFGGEANADIEIVDIEYGPMRHCE